MPSLELPHRMNPDGTIDSICPLCYATVGKDRSESQLERMEADHICDPDELAHFEECRRLTLNGEKDGSF